MRPSPIVLLLALLVASPFALAQAAIEAPLAYSGRIDLDGAPVDGAAQLRFGIVLSPGAATTCLSSGTCPWWEEHPNVDVAAGRFAVTLGEQTPFPGGLFSHPDLYLVVAIYDADAGWVVLGDRQRLLAAPRAARSEQIAPPIGSIVAWHSAMFASTPTLPEGWVRCDGQTLNDAWSPLNGRQVPNLNGEQRFLRGATASGALQDDQLQTHRHIDSGHTHPFTRPRWFSNETPNGEHMYNPEAAAASSQTSTTGVGAAQLGDPVDSGGNPVRHGGETRPKNMAVVWIMRVR